MAEISLAAAKNEKECVDVMKVVFGRLTDRGTNWRHVYKSLILLDYLVRTGPPLVVSESLYRIQDLYALETFEYVDEDGRDQGMHIRSKSAALIALINRKGLYENPDATTDITASGVLGGARDRTVVDGVTRDSEGQNRITESDMRHEGEVKGKSREDVDRVKIVVDELDPLSNVSVSKTETVIHGGSQRRRDKRTRRHTLTVPETDTKTRSSSIEPFPRSSEIRPSSSFDSRDRMAMSVVSPTPIHSSASVSSPLHSLGTQSPGNAPTLVLFPADANWKPPTISS